MNGIWGQDIVWIGVTAAVWTDALHDVAIPAPVLWPVTHVMVGPLVQRAAGAFAVTGSMRFEYLGGVFEQRRLQCGCSQRRTRVD